MGNFLAKFVILSSVICVSAFSFNHPEIRWKSVSTEHFKINYYDDVEAAVYPAWKIAEEVYAAISGVYGYKPKGKINLSLADYDDYSNGWAEWTSANIMVWIPDSRFDLRSCNTWLRNVITHELTHILTMENNKQIQLIDIAASVNLQSPDETIALGEVFPRITTFPNWLSEGIAQLQTEHQGNDCWDSRRDMVLRCAILNGKELTLDEMGHFNHNSLGNEMVYNHGFSFTKHIEREIGKEKLAQFFKNCSNYGLNFDIYFSEFTGYSLSRLYTHWRDSLKNEYREMISGKSTEEKVLVSSGVYNFSPEVSPDKRYLAYFSSGKDDGSRTDLYVRDLRSGETVVKENHAHTALAFSPDGKKIYFVKSRNPNRRGSYLNDVFSIDLGTGSKERISRDARVYDLAVSPDGNSLICVRYVKGIFGTYRYSLKDRKFVSLGKEPIGETVMHVTQCGNDINKLVISKLINGKSQLFIHDGTQMRSLLSSFAQIETPMFADDGRIYFSADFDGIYNIYSIDSSGAELKRHTDAVGGYFTPFRTPDGKILASRYGASGFAITEISPMSYSYTPDSTFCRCSFSSLPVPQGNVVIKSRPYKSTLLRPVWEMLLSGTYQTNRSLLTKQYIPYKDTSMLNITARLQSLKSDPLGKSFFGLVMDVGIFKNFTRVKNTDNFYSKEHGSLLLQDNSFSPFNEDDKNLTPVDKSLRSLSVNEIRSYSSSTQRNDDGTATTPMVPLIAPGLTFGRELGPVDFSMSVQLLMLNITVPYMLTTNVALDQQILRNLYGSIGVDYSWMPLQLNYEYQIPITLRWTRDGYVNTDIAYNMADVSVLSATYTPLGIPISYTSIDFYGNESTEYLQSKGYFAGIGGMHSIQIAKYSALQLSGTFFIQSMDTSVVLSGYDKKFDDGSGKYYLTNVSAAYVHPLVKDINVKLTRYWDALYGKVGYTLSCVTNEEFVKKSDFNSTAFKKYSFNDNLYIDHILNISLTCGATKAYLFNSGLTLDFNYHFLEKKAMFSLLWGI
ncbi:MAG: PD40 domain-containing protein [Chitinispirillaceae bacterium]|nr:PD40 domain-containing protein [Chitinispirillaceae bacterium]